MRKIKFRYYEKDEERGIEMKYAEPGIANMEYFFGQAYRNETLMQFTGLKDKNGREIYEGDVVEEKNVPVVGVVSFGEFNHYTYPEYGYFVKDEENINFPLFTYDLYFEVIGNKYENPELLKGV